MPPKRRNNNNNNNNRLFPNVTFTAGQALPATMPQTLQVTGDPANSDELIEYVHTTLSKMLKTYNVSLDAFDANIHGICGLPLSSEVETFRHYRVIFPYLKDRLTGPHKLFLSDGNRVCDAPLLLYQALVHDFGTDMVTTLQGGVSPLHFTAGAHPASALGAASWILASLCKDHGQSKAVLAFVDLDNNPAQDSVDVAVLDEFLCRVLFSQAAPVQAVDPLGSYSTIEKRDSSSDVAISSYSKTVKDGSHLESIFSSNNETVASLTTTFSFGGSTCYVVGCGLVKLIHPGKDFLDSSQVNDWFFTCAGFPDPSVLLRDTSLNPEVYSRKMIHHKNGAYSTENIIDLYVTQGHQRAIRLVSEVETIDITKAFRKTYGTFFSVVWSVLKWGLFLACTFGSIAAEFFCLYWGLYYHEAALIVFQSDILEPLRGSWIGSLTWGAIVAVHFTMLVMIAVFFATVFYVALGFRSRVSGCDPPFTTRVRARVGGFSSRRIPQTSDKVLELGGGTRLGASSGSLSSSGPQGSCEARSTETRNPSQEEVVRFNAKNSSVPDHSNARASPTPKPFYDANMQRLLNQYEPRRCATFGLHHVADFEDADDDLRTQVLGDDLSGYWPFSLTQRCLEAGMTENDFVESSGKIDTIKTIQGMLHYKNRRYENGIEMPRELNGSAYKDAQTFWNAMHHGLLATGYFDILQPRSLAPKIKVGNDGNISGHKSESEAFVNAHRKDVFSLLGVQPPDIVSPDHASYGVIEKYFFNWYARVEDKQNPYSHLSEASEKEFAHAVIQHKYHRETKFSDQMNGAFHQVWSKRRDNPGKAFAVKFEEEFNKRKSGNGKGMMA